MYVSLLLYQKLASTMTVMVPEQINRDKQFKSAGRLSARANQHSPSHILSQEDWLKAPRGHQAGMGSERLSGFPSNKSPGRI